MSDPLKDVPGSLSQFYLDSSGLLQGKNISHKDAKNIFARADKLLSETELKANDRGAINKRLLVLSRRCEVKSELAGKSRIFKVASKIFASKKQDKWKTLQKMTEGKVYQQVDHSLEEIEKTYISLPEDELQGLLAEIKTQEQLLFSLGEGNVFFKRKCLELKEKIKSKLDESHPQKKTPLEGVSDALGKVVGTLASEGGAVLGEEQLGALQNEVLKQKKILNEWKEKNPLEEVEAQANLLVLAIEIEKMIEGRLNPVAAPKEANAFSKLEEGIDAFFEGVLDRGALLPSKESEHGAIKQVLEMFCKKAPGSIAVEKLSEGKYKMVFDKSFNLSIPSGAISGVSEGAFQVPKEVILSFSNENGMRVVNFQPPLSLKASATVGAVNASVSRIRIRYDETKKEESEKVRCDFMLKNPISIMWTVKEKFTVNMAAFRKIVGL